MTLTELGAIMAARRFIARVEPRGIPVPIEPYLEEVGAILRRATDLQANEPGWSFAGPGGKRYICVNSGDPQQRQRFTICHEIAHFVLGLPSEHDAQPWWSAKRPLNERLCDTFAAELLLPERLFRPIAEDAPVGFASVAALASQFSASITATGSRFATAITTPCAFVLSENGKVRFAARSKPLMDANAWIAPRMGVPAGTVSQRARIGQEAGRGQIDAEIWFANWERGGTLAEEARHLTKWDQTLSLLWFESGEVPEVPHSRHFHRWEADAPERPRNGVDEDECIEELGNRSRWPTRRRRR